MSGYNKKNVTVADILKRKELEKNKQAQKNKRQENDNKRKLTAIEKRQQEQKMQMIEEIRNVYIPSIACQKTGISRATLYRWMADDYNFNKEFTKSRVEGRGAINDLAESKIVSKIKNDDTKATIFWLTHMHPNFINPILSISEETKEKMKLSPEYLTGLAKRLAQWKRENLH
ncbi:MAG: hypothetical protein WCT50_03835 [Patescibacteria group bacterium]